MFIIYSMRNFILPYKNIYPEIHKTAFIAPNASIIGDVKIGKDSNIWYSCVLRGDVNDIKIGERTNIQDSTVIHVTTKFQGTYIGNNVTVGHNATLHACKLEDFAFVGMNSCVMDGAIIENNAMLAAGSLLTPNKSIPTGELWSGSPAKYMRKLTKEELEYIKWSSSHYVELSKEHNINIKDNS